jgi:hypothetical protein
VDTVDPDWLDRAERLLKVGREIVIEVPRRYGGWTPTPGSGAERDLAEQVVADEAANLMLVQIPRTFASLQLRNAVEYLAGAAALLHERELHLNPPTLLRSAFESALTGFLVLDPRVGAREQRARGLLYEIASAERYRAATKHMVGTQHPAYPAAHQRWKRNIEVAEIAFPGEVSPDRATIAGQTRPVLEDAAKSWAQWREVAYPGGISEAEAGAFYEFLCLHTHPQGFSSHQAAFWTDPDEEPGFRADPVELAKFTLVTHGCVMDLARLFYAYHGWEVPELDAIATVADELWLDGDDTPPASPP